MKKFGIVALLATLLSVPVIAQDCIDYGSFPHLIGGIDVPGLGIDLAISGNYAFVPVDHSDLRIFDISDPEHPTLVGSLETTVRATDVKLAGGHAFVLDVRVGLEVFDITDPNEPIRLAKVEIVGFHDDLAVSGDTVFVLSRPSDDNLPSVLTVIDVGDPADPVVAAKVDMQARGKVFEVDGDRLYFMEYSAFMHIYDILIPTAPVLLHSLAIGTAISSFAVDGDLALVGGQEVRVVDLADPAGPAIVGSVDSFSYARAVAIDGHVGYLIDTQAGLGLIDLSDPTAPEIVATTGIEMNGRALEIVDDLAFLVGGGMSVVDVSNPTGPPILGQLDVLENPADVVVSGNLAYVADIASGLNVIDVSDPASPMILGSVVTQGNARSVALAGDMVCVAGGRNSALEIVDVSDPEAPEVVGALPNANYDTWNVAVAGSYAYTIWGEFWDQYMIFQKIQVVDISEPGDPVLVTTVTMPDRTSDITIHGSMAYVGGYYNAFHIVDLSIPETPYIVGSVETSGSTEAITIHDGYLYATGYEQSVDIFDIADPTFPQLISSVAVSMEITETAVLGSHLYLAGWRGGLEILDISVPANPVVCGRSNRPLVATGVATLDRHVLVVSTDGLQVFLPQCDDIVGILDEDEPVDTPSTDFHLAVAPNPFNPQTTVSFWLDRRQHVEVTVFDLRGRQVRTLVDGIASAGDHSVRWDGRNQQGMSVSSGTYVLRLASETTMRSEKMILVR